MPIKSLFSGLILAFSLFFSANFAYAGGGPVEFWVDPNTSLNPGEVYVVHARVSGNSPTYPNYCQNCLIHLKFQNPQDGDVVNQSNERTDENGQIFAKVVSKVPGKRVIYATDLQDSNGKLMETGNYVELNYTGQSNLPSTPVDNLYATINTQYVNGVKRLINVNWNFLPDIIKVNVYARTADNKDYGAAMTSSSMMYPRSAQIGLGSYFDWYVKVEACKTADSCVSSSEIFVPALKQANTPTNLRITQIETTNDPNTRNVHIMWDPIPEVTSYNIYKNAGSSYYYYTTVDTNLYEMKVSTKSTFYIAVTAKKNGQESSYSQVLTIDLAKEQTPNTNPSAKIDTYILYQQLDGSGNRSVTIKWGAFDGNPGTFTIYGRLTSNKNNWNKLLEGQKGPSATVSIANEDYYLKVYGCIDKVGTCAESSILLLPKIQIQDGKTIVQSPIPLQPGDSRIDDLNKKVSDLQNQLDQSKKTQSVLEQRISNLVNFIKKLFPFFK